MQSDYYLPASLGGLTYGVSSLEMASAYAALENNGKYREPTCIIKILDSDGNLIVGDDIKEKYIYDADAANSMTDILEGVFSRGTARGLGIDNGMPCAGKTGTTNDKKDGWFCGFTPYYTTAIWVGYDSPKTVSDLYGSSYPGRIWHTFMNDIHSALEVKKFPFEEKGTSSGSSHSSGGSSSSGSGSSSSRGDDDKDIDTDEDDQDNSVDIDPDDQDDSVDATKEPSATKTPATEAPATEVPATEAPATEPPAATAEPVEDGSEGGEEGEE